MVSTVKSRPNHYETLGLEPAASNEEIAQAFARAMRLPHAVAEVAQIGIAFDTLRNSRKRRAYDEALGLRPAPQPEAASSVMSFRISARLAAIAADKPIEVPPRAVPVVPPVRPSVSRSAGQSPLERRLQSRVAESPRDPLRPPPVSARPLPPRHKLQRAARQAVEHPQARIEDLLRLEPDHDEVRQMRWSRSALALGALVLVVVLIGAWAGAHAQDAGEPPPAPATVASTAARPHPNPASAAPSRASVSVATFAAPPGAVRTGHVRSQPRTRPSGERLADISRSLDLVAEPAAPETASDQPAAESPLVPAVAASLPLPKAVIARTIDRIGYACGEVASATAVAPGAYKITCTSGQSYQAKPVRGRYHFRRW